MRKGKLVTTVASILLWGLVSIGGRSQPMARAQQPNQVGLVVDFGGHYITRCIEFTESEITGYDVLSRAGLSIVVDASNPMGVTVCDINNTSGCPASNCFCQCQGSPCVYWSYHHLVNGSWQYSQLGVSLYKVHDGDVEGWGWGEGTINNSGSQPPVIPFDQICAPPVTATPLPTDTPVPPTPVPAPEAWFRLDENPIPAGSCTMLRWDTYNAQEIYLDGEAVDIIGSRQVCPTRPTDYLLRLLGLEGEVTYRLTLGVTESAATVTATPQPTAAPPSATADAGATTPPISPTPQATTNSSPSPTATWSPTPTPSPTAKPTATRTEGAAATASPSATLEQLGQAKPTTTPGAAEAEYAEDRASGEAEKKPATPDEDHSPSPPLPIGTVAFSLIVGGLLIWLIYILKFREQRA